MRSRSVPVGDPADRRRAAPAAAAEGLVKLGRPVTEGAAARPRLYALLDEARVRPIVWLGAEAGAGKTTLVSTWIEARRLPCLWYQLGDEDRDIATFFMYLGIAARRFSHDRPPLPLLTVENRQRLPGFSRLFFQELFARLPSQCVMVLDNLERLAGSEKTLDVLAESLELAPSGTNVVLVGRGEPPRALARQCGRRRVAVIGPEALRLTPDESASLRRAALPDIDFAPEVEARMDAFASGWAAGLVLLIEWVRRTGTLPEHLDDVGPPGLFDYFAAEVLARLDEDTQRFLCRSAILSSVTAGIAADLTGTPRAGEILARLHRECFFTARHEGREPTFTFHPAFRDFLLGRLRATESREALQALEDRAGRLLQEAGLAEEAIGLLLRARRLDRAVPALCALVPEMCESGRVDTLDSWLDDLPGATVEDEPWLVYASAMCSLGRSVPDALRLLRRALDGFIARGEPRGAYAAWAELVETHLMLFSDLAPLDDLIAALADLERAFPCVPGPALEVRVTAARLNALLCRQPARPDAETTAEHLLSVIRSLDAIGQLRAGGHLLTYYCLRGDDESAYRVRAGLGHLDNDDCPTPVRMWWRLAVACHLFHAGPADEALAVVDRGLELESTAIPIGRQLMITGGVVALAVGDPARARRYLERLRAWSLRDEVSPLGLGLLVTGLALERRDADAVAHARRTVDELERLGHQYFEQIAQLMLAIALIASGDAGEAAGVLARALERARRTANLRIEYLLLLVDADHLLALGDPDADRRLREAWSLGRARGFLRATPFLPRALTARVAGAPLARGIEVAHVREVVRAQALVPADAAGATTAWPWKLEVRTLGRFVVSVDGEPLRPGRKAQLRPLELLKAIVGFGERDVPRSVLADALWPDADGDCAHEALEVTLRRLRKLCRDPGAVVRAGGCLSLDEGKVWTDVRALTESCRCVDLQPAAGTADQQAAQLFDLYRGDFLCDEELAWAEPVRERLRERFARTVTRLARDHERRGAWEQALDCYQRGAHASPRVEQFYLGLIRCHTALGERAQALDAAERARRTLGVRLETEP